MTKQAADRVWFAVGSLLFIFLWNAMSLAFNWGITLLGVTAFGDVRDGVALIALFAGLPAACFLLGVGIVGARQSPHYSLRQRLPDPFLTGSWRSTLLHSGQIVAFIVLPAFFIVRLEARFYEGAFYRMCSVQCKITEPPTLAPDMRACYRGQGDLCSQQDSTQQIFVRPGANRKYVLVGDGASCHLGIKAPADAFESRRYVYQGGEDYIPFWLPWLFVSLRYLALLLLLWFVFELLRPKLFPDAPFPVEGRFRRNLWAALDSLSARGKTVALGLPPFGGRLLLKKFLVRARTSSTTPSEPARRSFEIS